MEENIINVSNTLGNELASYLKSAYLGKSPLLLQALSEKLLQEDILYKKPYIESTPAYKTAENGIQKSPSLPDWLKDYFLSLSKDNLGVHSSPYVHQIKALESFMNGDDLFVATGTGSGKTECFMWPLIAKLTDEARNFPESWMQRGVRALILYPMNALVSDQVSRLRKLIGDDSGRFLKDFRSCCGDKTRRPQFGMYTGRTPYPGEVSDKNQDKDLAKSLERLCPSEESNVPPYFQSLKNQGKIPAKKDLLTFIQNLRNNIHSTDEEDAELITRFEIQKTCPDILITNYSMLELMLLRPRESSIWQKTKQWLNMDQRNKLLFVIDEAHMYRGSFGGEVALLIRRLMAKLNVGREKFQFILTTASMPKGRNSEVLDFADRLTAAASSHRFVYLTGDQYDYKNNIKYEIPLNNFLDFSLDSFDPFSERGLFQLNKFFENNSSNIPVLNSIEEIPLWLFNNLPSFRQFSKLLDFCKGRARSFQEIISEIFGENLSKEEGSQALSVLLSIAPLAKNENGLNLFPARMHLLYRGLNGLYACTNKACSESNEYNGLSLGKIYISSKGNSPCNCCGSAVYGLYNDRRCGALFLKGFVSSNFYEKAERNEPVYLWSHKSGFVHDDLLEIHLFIPEKNYEIPKQSKTKTHLIKQCYIDPKTGFIYFNDYEAHDNFLRLCYNLNSKFDEETVSFSFNECPHCTHRLSEARLTSFKTRGNQSFYNLMKTVFKLQPPVKGKDHDLDRLPNQGRKILTFSDSRARAARLALDMSQASDYELMRQLISLAVRKMSEYTERTDNFEYQNLDSIYGFFCEIVSQKNLQLFSGADRKKLKEHCDSYKLTQSPKRRSRSSGSYSHNNRTVISEAPTEMNSVLLRLFCGSYNTFYDTATIWLEPSEKALDSIAEIIDWDSHDEDFYKDVFNAWIMYIMDKNMALGHTFSDEDRRVISKYVDNLGLDENWDFSKTVRNLLNLDDNPKLESDLKKACNVLLEWGNDNNNANAQKKYLNIKKLKPCLDENHVWFRCSKCSEITPRLLMNKCPTCGSSEIHELSSLDKEALQFWSTPIKHALEGKKLFSIDTEEHTAQLSYKDQREELWAKTEEYEMRFQDILQEDEIPVDILSSTTTMEVGIDIGSLVAVGLRNIPPTRENYQQRAGRAGRRGASLSTIVTYCEDGPHDTLYFNNPTPMFSGEPRTPWIDIDSKKLIERHLNMVLFQRFLSKVDSSLDSISAKEFFSLFFNQFLDFICNENLSKLNYLFPSGFIYNITDLAENLKNGLVELKAKIDKFPELYTNFDSQKDKSLLDSLYEEGLIPTYSFPKNVVKLYINESMYKPLYQIERGLDLAISEYAPGRSIVVDKKQYQIGGIGLPSKSWKKYLDVNGKFFGDENYQKELVACKECEWFDIRNPKEKLSKCPSCGAPEEKLSYDEKMIRPWGFAPLGGREEKREINEKYSHVLPPLYSTVASADEIKDTPNCRYIRHSVRANQRIIMLNKGYMNKGFYICNCCGLAVSGDSSLESIKKLPSPYSSKHCAHNFIKTNLGYDFKTDMLVFEIAFPDKDINLENRDLTWIKRAAQSAAEALRLAASEILDIEFTELVTGYRYRKNQRDSYVDLYIYDQLSSGAGYSSHLKELIPELLSKTRDILNCKNSCESACYHCLKHYRNQFVHDHLDRFAAIDLLNWGIEGKFPDVIDYDKQKEYVKPIESIISQLNLKILYNDSMKQIEIVSEHFKKLLNIYPSMLRNEGNANSIAISEIYAKYGKPIMIKKILEAK